MPQQPWDIDMSGWDGATAVAANVLMTWTKANEEGDRNVYFGAELLPFR